MGLAWTEAAADEYIKTYHLQQLYFKLEERYAMKFNQEMIKIITVATHMRDSFFKLYSGLGDRIEFNRNYAQEHGYIRYIFGGSRNLIPLLLAGEYDKRERGKILNNLRNVAANADIQNFESAVINQAMVLMDAWLREQGMRSYIFNMVHDSCDMVVYNDEEDVVIKKLREVFELDRPEFKKIPLPVDISIADLTAGDYYKHGADV